MNGERPGGDATNDPETRVVSVLVGLLTLGLVDNQLLAPVLPEIASSLATEETTVGLTVVGYAIAAASAALVVGPFSDRLGRRRFLLGAGGLFALGSVVAAVSPSFNTFLAARMLTGSAAGVISALVVAAIADRVPYERRGRAMGWVAVAYFAAPILGVPLAARAADAFDWRVNYAAFGVLGLVASISVALWFHDDGDLKARPRGSYLRFLRRRSTAAGAISAFFVTGGLTGFLLFLGAYLRSRFSLSLTEVGNVFLLTGLATLVGALAAGRVADRIGKLRVAIAGSAGLALFLIVVPETVGLLHYLTLALVGLSAAARVAPLQSLVTQLVSQEERGAYVALRNTLSQGGSATAAALASALYDKGFHYICWMTSAFTVIALVLMLFIDEPTEESS